MESEPKGKAIRYPQSSTQAVPFVVQYNASWRC
jgi:hypothetical protein